MRAHRSATSAIAPRSRARRGSASRDRLPSRGAVAGAPVVRDPVETYRDQRAWAPRTCSKPSGSADGVRAVVIVTSDKCYENSELASRLSRERPARRARSLLEQQGLRRAGRRNAYRDSFFAATRHRRRDRARGQRHRRRRLGRGPAGPRRRSRAQRRPTARASQPARRAAVAARARAAAADICCWPRGSPATPRPSRRAGISGLRAKTSRASPRLSASWRGIGANRANSARRPGTIPTKPRC